jgi:hypothetical protein
MSPTPNENRKFVWMGMILVAWGCWLAFDAISAWRAGTMIHRLNAPALEPFAALGMAILLILFGILAVLAGLGILKPRGGRPG